MENNLNILRDEQLVAMAQEGSQTAEEYVIRKYKSLALSKAQNYYIMGGDREDVIQEGMIGIFKAIHSFDPEGEASFRTFVELCVTRQIIKAIDGANRQKHQILNNSLSLNDDDSEDGSGEPLINRLQAGESADPEALALINEVVESLVADGVKVFSPMENQIWSRLLLGKNYREIAKDLGRTPKSVDNAIQRIRKKVYGLLK